MGKRNGKFVKQEAGAVEAIENGISEIESLQEEMSEWRDNMEDKLSSTQKYSDVTDCADSLETGQDSLQSALEEVTEAIESLEGKPFKAGCPEHVVGTPCERCKWDGEARIPSFEPTLDVYETPKKSPFSKDHLFVCSIWHSQSCSSPFDVGVNATAEDIEEQVAEARERFSAEHAKWAADNAADKLIPHRLPDEPEELPLDALADISETKASWQDWTAYGHKSISRADRMSNATSAITAGIEALRSRIESFKADENTQADDRIDELESAIEEVESAISKLEGIEFPGMY